MSPAKQKQIVTIGGGTGTFIVLSGLKHFSDVTLSAIVSVGDDGGSTGRLRDAYGFLPMGDARRALVALSNGDDPLLMRSLFEYRFAKGDVAGHSFGNLLLTALADMFGSGAKAIEAASRILRVKGYVIPASEKQATLVATLQNGETIVGENNIDKHARGRSPIVNLTTTEEIPANPSALASLRDADLVILGPGDLYTSILPNFAVSGMKEALRESRAKVVYIVNLFTKTGQTENCGAAGHVEKVARYTGRKPDIIIMNTGAFPEDILARYREAGEDPVRDDLPQEASIIRGSFAGAVPIETAPHDAVLRSLIRHDPKKIAAVIQTLL